MGRTGCHNRVAKFTTRVVRKTSVMATFGNRRSTCHRFRRVGRGLGGINAATRFCTTLAGPYAEFIGTVVCTIITILNSVLAMGNNVSMNGLSSFLACYARCAGPFGRVSDIITRFRGTLTDTRHMFGLLSYGSRPSSRNTGRLGTGGNAIRFGGISFSCGGGGPFVRKLGVETSDNGAVTVMKPANYNGAALVGLLVEFCSIANNRVSVSGMGVTSIAHSSLHSKFKVILRSA